MVTRKPRNWPSIVGSQEERAREAFRRLEYMTRLISDWVWETDANGKITYVSERIIDRLGMHPIQALGKTLEEIGSFEKHQDEKNGPNLKRPFRDMSFTAQGHDGKERYFAISGLPRFDNDTGDFIGSTGIAKDVTELVRVERANMQLADAIEVMSGYFALYDEDDRLVISNARFRELNRQFGDLAQPGSKFQDLLDAEIKSGRYTDADDNPESWARRRMARRRQTSGPFELDMSNGRRVFVDEERLPNGATVTMARDITDLKRAMDALQKSDQHHRDFAASVAHQLRTPLAVLRSNLDSLGEGDNVRDLKREVDALARMVEQLLTLTRYDNLVVQPGSKADLNQIAINVVSGLAPTAIKEDRSLELDGVEGSLIINGDAGALEHALRNLVENAIKYSSRGSEIIIRLTSDPVSIQVLDHGRGVPLQQRAKLFEKFTRSDRRGSGAGLGLNIVKAISDAHEAELFITENNGGGSIFTISFPVQNLAKADLHRF